jgi:hypothetical protein
MFWRALTSVTLRYSECKEHVTTSRTGPFPLTFLSHENECAVWAFVWTASKPVAVKTTSCITHNSFHTVIYTSRFLCFEIPAALFKMYFGSPKHWQVLCNETLNNILALEHVFQSMNVTLKFVLRLRTYLLAMKGKCIWIWERSLHQSLTCHHHSGNSFKASKSCTKKVATHGRIQEHNRFISWCLFWEKWVVNWCRPVIKFCR